MRVASLENQPQDIVFLCGVFPDAIGAELLHIYFFKRIARAPDSREPKTDNSGSICQSVHVVFNVRKFGRYESHAQKAVRVSPETVPKVGVMLDLYPWVLYQDRLINLVCIHLCQQFFDGFLPFCGPKFIGFPRESCGLLGENVEMSINAGHHASIASLYGVRFMSGYQCARESTVSLV